MPRAMNGLADAPVHDSQPHRAPRVVPRPPPGPPIRGPLKLLIALLVGLPTHVLFEAMSYLAIWVCRFVGLSVPFWCGGGAAVARPPSAFSRCAFCRSLPNAPCHKHLFVHDCRRSGRHGPPRHPAGNAADKMGPGSSVLNAAVAMACGLRDLETARMQACGRPGGAKPFHNRRPKFRDENGKP